MKHNDGIFTKKSINEGLVPCIYCGVTSKDNIQILISGSNYSCCTNCKVKANEVISNKLNNKNSKKVFIYG